MFLKSLFNLFYPEPCLTCAKPLVHNEVSICTICRNELPKTHFINYKTNQAAKLFYGKVKLENVAAYYWYSKQHIIQELIFQLKYRNHQEIGELLGNWIAFDIKKSTEFKAIDYIIPVPLHPEKFKKRGYNQLTVFGETLARGLDCTLKENVLFKIKNTVSQTKAGKEKRWKNTQNVFALAETIPTHFEGKHFLLIDDVLTTGATILACALELKKIPKSKVSILTIAMGA